MSLVIRHKENRKEYWGLQANVSSITYGTDGSYTLTLAAGKSIGLGATLNYSAPAAPAATGWFTWTTSITGAQAYQGSTVIANLAFATLTQDYAGTISAFDAQTTTDTSAFNYTGIIRGTMGHVNIVGSGTIAYAEGVAGVVSLKTGSSAVLTNGYGTGGELILNSGYTGSVGTFSGLLGQIELQGAAGITNGYGVQGYIYNTAGQTGVATNGYGVYGLAQHANAQTWTETAGMYALLQNTNIGTITGAYGVLVKGQNTSTGTLTELNGVSIQMTNNGGGTITNWMGLRVRAPVGTATTTTSRGVRVDNHGNAGTTSAYGVTILDQSGAVTNNIALAIGTGGQGGTWAINCNSASDSAIGGPLIIGSSTAHPTASTLTLAPNWDILIGTGAATNMTAGFTYVPGAAGAATGAPTNASGTQFPLYWDSTNLQLYVRTGGAWKKSAAFT